MRGVFDTAGKEPLKVWYKGLTKNLYFAWIPLLQPSRAQSVGEARYAEGVRDGSEPPEDDRQSGFYLAKLFFPDRRLLWPPAVVLATSSGLDSH